MATPKQETNAQKRILAHAPPSLFRSQERQTERRLHMQDGERRQGESASVGTAEEGSRLFI